MIKKLTIILSIIFLTGLTLQKTRAYEAFNGDYTYNRYNSGNNIKTGGNNEETLLIVDYSNSMNIPLQGKRRMTYAINAIEEIMKNMEPSSRIGLRIFGHSRGPVHTKEGYVKYQKEICSASTLISPISPYNARNIAARLKEHDPQGATPIGYSLRQAVNSDFSYGSGMKHIVLITDGGENCGDDPCRYIKTLMKTRNDIKIDVIGITLAPNEYSQLRCIANEGGGSFYDVRQGSDFKPMFARAINAAPSNGRSTYPPPVNYNTGTNVNAGGQANVRVQKAPGIIYKNYLIETVK